MGGAAWWTRSLGTEAADSKADGHSHGQPVSSTIFVIALGKFLFGVAISLALNDWWTYGGGPDVPGNDISLASCSDPTVGNCFSFCGDVHIIPVNITDDDVVTDYVNGQSDPQTYEYTQSSSYCTATFPGYCGYQYWFDFKLFPMCLQFLQVLLQTILWRFGSDEFPATPQKGQYDLILEQMYPQMCPETGGKGDLKRKQPEATLASRVALLGRLTTPVFPSLFWFLELVTLLFVWAGLLYPPVYCGSTLPLSLYYYPIMMSLLDLMKLNIYASVELFAVNRNLESALVMLNLQLLFTHMWITVALGVMYVAFVFRDCTRGLLWCLDGMAGRGVKLEWSVEGGPSDADTADLKAVEMTAGGGNSGETVNPMVDVEVAGVDPTSIVVCNCPGAT